MFALLLGRAWIRYLLLAAVAWYTIETPTFDDAGVIGPCIALL